ncbi:cytochrome c oxidase assembly protein [Stutzerimonas kunmingensis]|uniref:cytochrome c oxidase assembly protein n=1 Tax=Stutzerimonas kunmingensis TaxID=1211807 RepID=UPI0005B3A735|nr:MULTISPECIES: cytochrome c oxidase assembly protein [Stutzerimonas stutzeri group]KJS78846.1 MAG: membrane protein [[Pseudomonas] sp. BICA1-14]
MDHGVHNGSMGGSAALVVLLVVLPSVLLIIYLVVAGRELRRSTWSGWRTASFAVGTLLIIAAISPPLSDWAHRDLSGHMVQHLLLGMFGPLALVLGAPGTLLLRNIPVTIARRIVAFLATRPIRFLIHPITAALLDIGGMYVLYLTPLYVLSMTDPLVYVLLHLHFVISGYLFTWSIAGPDPAPHRAGMPMRLTVVFLATAAHANLGKLMYGYGYPRGTMADLSELQAAAQWMYYGGDLAELLLIIAFFAMWFRRRNILPVAFADRRQGLY